MGPGDDDVVDAQLKVRGTINLRVVDASVLPIMVTGKPERASDRSGVARRRSDECVTGAPLYAPLAVS